ncbi:NCS1 family nucleobase:cation symporter-1 [Aquamicrobium sp. LC103]|uniref:NCS1 family nucleobase:cation symporter-1 n=1 Tax=Aquamicrobium sp. LC103 TaxID=1120658 RepID=UPI00063EAF0A|nr:NCS1 family nucleobase:cation symporter-1 [Aquamicrobium sp. LC103]TKT81337.1 NCS1 family nucleobase:cation symporter-1 [Aquamicrobium sp. LC103]
MQEHELTIRRIDPSLYNEDLAPLHPKKRKWGWFEIFNVWANDVQSLFGYTLAASLFLTYGLNGWAVFAAIVVAGFIVMFLVNLSGRPSVKYGIPYPVMARASMGVRGANFPALVRGIVAIFWYGVQTYFASTAVALLINSVFGISGGAQFLGMTAVGWISYVIVCAFQLALFLRGIDSIARFLNWAGPLVYVVMIALMIAIWYQAGGGLLSAVGDIFQGTGTYEGSSISAFVAIVGTMVAYFAAVIINFGDFSRFVKTESEMRKGNLLGLPGNLALFSFIALFVTAGTVAVFGEALTNPAEIVERVDNLLLTVVAAITFFAATVGINLVANFIPPAYDLANLSPSRISSRTGGIIAAVIAFFIGALWVSFISNIGITGFVDTLGAVLAPLYGILVVDYYLVRRRQLDVQQLFSAEPGSAYYYDNGWNMRALVAFFIAAVFSVASVWVPALADLSGFAWLIGAALGGGLHYVLMRGHTVLAPAQ